MMKPKISREFDDTTSIDKTQILQEAKECFMATSVRTKKLIEVLTRCVFMLLQGEKLTTTEATDLFFHITRLFQYKDKDTSLRRLIFIGIKALSHQAENTYVVTSSLTNDVNSTVGGSVIRASALRALCHISDASTFTSIERYLKQSIVDRNPEVASAALSSLIHITGSDTKSVIGTEIVKRCTSEIHVALNSDNPMVQYHALALRYNSCHNDKLAISRLIKICIRSGLKSPIATGLLIKIIHRYINDFTPEDSKECVSYVKDKLTHQNDMVRYEAANAIADLAQDFTELSKKRLINVVGEFLNSSRPALKFSAVKILNKVAEYAPSDVRNLSLDLENLISQSDCNTSIAILAITTLLKIGTESSVEKFLKQIREFLSEIDDEYKVIVVGSVRQLCKKYPSKHAVIMDFLSNMLREEGGYSYKRAIVDTIINMIKDSDDTIQKALEILCEFIEDCDHISLAVEIIYILGREGPRMDKPHTYIRCIGNRVLLDPTPVACAAITALAKFGCVPELKEDIRAMLYRFSFHEDYEVMERASFYVEFLNLQSQIFPKEDVSAQPIDETIVFEPVVTSSSPPPGLFEEYGMGELIYTSEPARLTDSVSEFEVKLIRHMYKEHILFQLDCTNTVESMVVQDLTIEMTPPQGYEVLASTVHPKLACSETASLFVCAKKLHDSMQKVHDSEQLTLDYLSINLKFKIDDCIEELFPLEDYCFDMSSD